MTSHKTHGTAHSIEFRVRYAETDQMQVVYHSNYLIWCEMGRTEFIRALGTPYAELERQNVTLAVVEASLRFHSGARYDNLIRVTTTIRDVRHCPSAPTADRSGNISRRQRRLRDRTLARLDLNWCVERRACGNE